MEGCRQNEDLESFIRVTKGGESERVLMSND